MAIDDFEFLPFLDLLILQFQQHSKSLKEKAVSGVAAKNACTTQNLTEEAFTHVATAKAIRSKYYYVKNIETIKFPTVRDLTFDLPEQYCWTDQKNPEWF